MERPKIIRVESQFDPESDMLCCGKPAEQKQINYELTIGGDRFRIPKVWASVCQVIPTEHVYFQPGVGEEISDRIFRRQHSVEYRVSQLLG